MHDHRKSYFKIADVRHALCKAHHLRELQALAELDGEAWASPMQQLLWTAGQAARIACEEGFTLQAELIAWFERQYDHWVAAALEYHEGLEPLSRAGPKGRKKRRPGHNLALRLRDYKTETLRFLHDPEVPFTNNQAERRAQDFATLRSVLSTAQKQGRNRIEALRVRPCCSTHCAARAPPAPLLSAYPATSALDLGVSPPSEFGLGRSSRGVSGPLPFCRLSGSASVESFLACVRVVLGRASK